MRISGFQVQRYRSIEKSESIDLTNLTVLVGPNNEGKSNILRAIVVGLEALKLITDKAPFARRSSGIIKQRLDHFESYSWSRDFPVHLQASTPGAHSAFEFKFTLSEAEIAEFKEEIGHSLNGELKVRILIGNNGNAQFKIVKQGPGSAGLNANIKTIARFISHRIRVEYVPVARTFDQSEIVVRREASSILRELSSTSEYQKAESTLNRLLAEALRPLERRVLEGVQEFLPDVNSIAINCNSSPYRLRGMEVDIEMDDGHLTNLSAKGDGVQSLVTMSLVRMLSRQHPQRTYLLAVEEPEAHLHPGAIHKLRQALDEIADSDQVILTTHSPILVRRDNPQGNILVNNNTAAPASSLSLVRESLGIRLPDNMSSAEVVLLVEGKHDQTIVSHLLRTESALIEAALREGRLEIRSAHGASNIPYQYRLFRDSVCSTHILLDNDKQGRKACSDLESKESLNANDVTMVTANDMNESEIEDLLDPSIYTRLLQEKYNVEVNADSTNPEKRFAHRAKDYFGASGQRWNDSVEANLKTDIAEAVTSLTTIPIIEKRRGVVRALTNAILRKLSLN